jgi:peptidoglycan-associated lipoprotein
MVRAVRTTAKMTTVSLAVSVLIVGMTVMGCAKKTHVTDESALGEPGSGYAPGEEALNERGSLERYRRGLEPEEGGVLKDVRFAYDSYALDAVARDVLAANAQWLKENPGTHTEIEGHCDERGTVEYNLALGARRAKAVKDYLVALGIAADRLSTISYGEELPLCREQTDSCYARNRRVHFVPPQ